MQKYTGCHILASWLFGCWSSQPTVAYPASRFLRQPNIERSGGQTMINSCRMTPVLWRITGGSFSLQGLSEPYTYTYTHILLRTRIPLVLDRHSCVVVVVVVVALLLGSLCWLAGWQSDFGCTQSTMCQLCHLFHGLTALERVTSITLQVGLMQLNILMETQWLVRHAHIIHTLDCERNGTTSSPQHWNDSKKQRHIFEYEMRQCTLSFTVGKCIYR